MPRLFTVLICLSFIAPSVAQTSRSLEKKLNIFWNSKRMRAKMVAETVGLHPGDTIADIGTADGWFAAVLSTYTDSATFYLEDIDSSIWNRNVFDTASIHFAARNKNPSTNHFVYVKGSERSTELPLRTFHTVLIIDTYHHFTHRDEMLANAVALLKPGGKIAILEALARRPGDFHQGCRQKIYSEDEIISHLGALGMKLENLRFIHKVAGRKNKLFLFTKT